MSKIGVRAFGRYSEDAHKTLKMYKFWLRHTLEVYNTDILNSLTRFNTSHMYSQFKHYLTLRKLILLKIRKVTIMLRVNIGNEKGTR
jgi:hypothetical protein